MPRPPRGSRKPPARHWRRLLGAVETPSSGSRRLGARRPSNIGWEGDRGASPLGQWRSLGQTGFPFLQRTVACTMGLAEDTGQAVKPRPNMYQGLGTQTGAPWPAPRMLTV